MSPPVSHIERGNPPPRRKSCLACVKSKRRCDQALPSCLRCAQRRIPCEYPSRNRRAQPLQEAQHAAPFSSEDKHGEQQVSAEEMAGDDLWLTLDEPAGCSSFSWMNAHVPIELREGPSPEFETTSEWPSIPNLLPVTDVCYGSVITTGHYDMEWVSSRMNNNLAYAIEKIKSAPITMLLELHTPWSHESLYKNKMPRVMQGQCCFVQAFPTGLTQLERIRCTLCLRSVRIQEPRQWAYYHAVHRCQSERPFGVPHSYGFSVYSGSRASFASVSDHPFLRR